MFCTNTRIKLQAPQGIHRLCKKHPMVKIVTSEIDDSRVIPGLGEFADHYFGKEWKSQRGFHGYPRQGKVLKDIFNKHLADQFP